MFPNIGGACGWLSPLQRTGRTVLNRADSLMQQGHFEAAESFLSDHLTSDLGKFDANGQKLAQMATAMTPTLSRHTAGDAAVAARFLRQAYAGAVVGTAGQLGASAAFVMALFGQFHQAGEMDSPPYQQALQVIARHDDGWPSVAARSTLESSQAQGEEPQAHFRGGLRNIVMLSPLPLEEAVRWFAPQSDSPAPRPD